MKWLGLIVLMTIGVWYSLTQLMRAEQIPVYIPPVDLNLYACAEINCEVIAVVPADTQLTMLETVVTEQVSTGREHIWKHVQYGEQSGYIGKWESNAYYLFDDVRACAGYDCEVIDTIDETTMILFAGVETIDVVQFWQRIVYNDVRVGFVGPKSPGASKQQQMITAATQTAEAERP